MTEITINSGETITQDPNDSKTYVFDWDDNLEAGVELVDAGEFTVTANDESSPLLEVDEVSLEEGNRSVLFRLTGGLLGRKYRVAHLIETAESPEQRMERSFYVKVQNK